jgi:ribonuclease HII
MVDLTHELSVGGLVCGVDEAGRGPCAGPLCVAAVILNTAKIPDGINDSKALPEARRFALEPEIKTAALAWSVITVTIEEIDALNILGATMVGMARAVAALTPAAGHALIDGNRCPKLDIPATALVGGDARSLSIAAASILAKTARDRIMIELDSAYPMYGFKKHKGYQAEAHLDALRLHGPSPVHRRSWSTIRELITTSA